MTMSRKGERERGGDGERRRGAVIGVLCIGFGFVADWARALMQNM